MPAPTRDELDAALKVLVARHGSVAALARFLGVNKQRLRRLTPMAHPALVLRIMEESKACPRY
jgi:hypothetical protein